AAISDKHHMNRAQFGSIFTINMTNLGGTFCRYHHLFSERAIMIVLLRLQPTYSTGTQPLQGYVRYKGIISGTDGRLAITQSPTARCVASGPSACTRTTAPIPGTIGSSIRYSRSPLKTSFA